MLAAAWLAVLASPVVAEVPGAHGTPGTPVTPVATAAGQTPAELLPDERDGPLQPLALIVPAALIIALSTLGLTLTFRSLRDDLKQRKNVYRQRGNHPSMNAPGSMRTQ